MSSCFPFCLMCVFPSFAYFGPWALGWSRESCRNRLGRRESGCTQCDSLLPFRWGHRTGIRHGGDLEPKIYNYESVWINGADESGRLEWTGEKEGEKSTGPSLGSYTCGLSREAPSERRITKGARYSKRSRRYRVLKRRGTSTKMRWLVKWHMAWARMGRDHFVLENELRDNFYKRNFQQTVQKKSP